MALFRGIDKKDVHPLAQFYALELPVGWEDNFSLLCSPDCELYQWEHPSGGLQEVSRRLGVALKDGGPLLELARLHVLARQIMDAIADEGYLPAGVVRQIEIMARQEAENRMPRPYRVAVDVMRPDDPHTQLAIQGAREAYGVLLASGIRQGWIPPVADFEKTLDAFSAASRTPEHWSGAEGVFVEYLPPDMPIPAKQLRETSFQHRTTKDKIIGFLHMAIIGDSETELRRCNECNRVFVSTDAEKCSQRCRKRKYDRARAPDRKKPKS